MNEQPLRVALVGVGAMGSQHALSYMRMPDVRLAGIAGISEDEARPMAEKAGCRPYAGLEPLLDAEAVDVVDVCVPTPFHKDAVLTAARAKKQVICEKPLARHLEDAEAMAAACRESGVRLFVGHVLRFFPQYVAAHEAVVSGSIGNPAIARTFRGNGFPAGIRNWYADPMMSGGLLLDLVLHDFDWLRWTLGEVERVYARGLVNDIPKGRDYALITLRHRSGALSHVEGTWSHTTPFNMKLEVAGDKGLIDYNDARTRPVTYTPRATSETKGPRVAVPESPLADDPYYLELRHFIDVIQGKAEPRVTPKDGIEAMRIALAALESVQTNRAITLST